MSDSLYQKNAGDLSSLIKEALIIAREYCSLNNPQRDEILQSNKDFYSIKIWDNNIIMVKPIKFVPDEAEEIGDAIWVDCNQDKYALEAFLSQLLGGVKQFFLTHSKDRDSNDILKWQIQKSS